MRTWIAKTIDGRQAIVSGFTESEARQKAENELGWGEIISWSEM